MEVGAQSSSLKERLSGLFLKEKTYFLNRREINWPLLSKCGLSALGVGVIGLLLLPTSEAPRGEFHVKGEYGRINPEYASDPTAETLAQLSHAGATRHVPSSLDHLYGGAMPRAATQSGGNPDRNSSMIVAQEGRGSRDRLPAGTRLPVRLIQAVIASNQPMPVIGVVIRDVTHEDGLAVPQGSKVFGELSFDDGGDRAGVSWKSIQFPDGRERPVAAIGVGLDGQVGVSGRVRSEALKNTIGQTLTRFVGAYAEGSMQRGAFGGNPGGSDNGWKNAIAETARDRADSLANDIQKEKRWIEVSPTMEFLAVLSAPLAFRDPGATYGR